MFPAKVIGPSIFSTKFDFNCLCLINVANDTSPEAAKVSPLLHFKKRKLHIFPIELKEKRDTDRTIVSFTSSHETGLEGCKAVMLAFLLQGLKRVETRSSSSGENEPQDLQMVKIMYNKAFILAITRKQNGCPPEESPSCLPLTSFTTLRLHTILESQGAQ